MQIDRAFYGYTLVKIVKCHICLQWAEKFNGSTGQRASAKIYLAENGFSCVALAYETALWFSKRKKRTLANAKGDFCQYWSLQTQPVSTWHHLISPRLSSAPLKHTFTVMVGAFGKVISDWIHYIALKTNPKWSFHFSLITAGQREGLAAEKQCWRIQLLA